MTRMPQTRTDMIALVRDAMQRQDADAPTADPEHLVMLATGRADELPAPDRARLLRAVASDPQTSQLVAELRAMDLDEPAAPPKTRGSPNWFRATRYIRDHPRLRELAEELGLPMDEPGDALDRRKADARGPAGQRRCGTALAIATVAPGCRRAASSSAAPGRLH